MSLVCNVLQVTHLSTSQQARISVDIMYDTANTTTSPKTPGEHASALQSHLNTCFGIFQNQLSKTHQRQKDFYNRKVHGELHKPGDLVMVALNRSWKGEM